MNYEELYNSIRDNLKNKLHFLEDKPEETVESTLKALWLAASGFPVSAEGALKLPLLDLTKKQIKTLYQLIELRLNNTPLAHITKRQNFMGIELISDKRALIPRKETELVGKKAIELSVEISKIKSRVNVIDVCCGSGNLGLAVAYFNPNCIVYATDISSEAVELTKDNINLLNLSQRVRVKQGDLLSEFETDEFYENVDLIICNPPYILSSKVQLMHSEIATHEPTLAFDGGMLGIRIVQKLIHESLKFLTPGGWLAFEVGAGQGDFIIQLCNRTNSYMQIISVPDEKGIIRVIALQKPLENQPVLKSN
jgi:release factor glutamine methyltransferase